MRYLLKRHIKKQPPAIEPVATQFPALRGAELAAVFSGKRQGGDFYDALRVNSSRVLFGLVDLPVRREKNEQMLSALQRIFRVAGAQLLRPAEANEPEALIELCLQLNHSLIETAGIEHSSPAFAGCYNEDLGTVTYFNAGHTPGLVRHTSDVSQLGVTGLPLGLFSHTTTDAQMMALEPGAALLLVSRGVVATKRKGKEYGLRRVEETLKNAPVVNAQDLCTTILEAMQRFAHTSQREDITALALIRSCAAG
jgi:serine phosphatase RsbU (regulator of sigma subunit)